ncbi:MAG: hypothetical protein KF878_11955 [Planctomycetes bacterium]|nr:hypothetical protein [Planctomycetota bacterium]
MTLATPAVDAPRRSPFLPVLRLLRPRAEVRRAGGRTGVPWAVLLLVLASWTSFLLIDERDEFAVDHPLYIHFPDFSERPWRIVPNLVVTPLVNTQPDQIVLVTALLLGFGIPVERRLGSKVVLGVFWGATAMAAVLGAGALHVLYPLFPDVHAFSEGGWYRVFNGGSAGGFGLMGAMAATSRFTAVWVALYCLWEPSFWLVVTQDFTAVLHVTAFFTGLGAAGVVLRRRTVCAAGPGGVRSAPVAARRGEPGGGQGGAERR